MIASVNAGKDAYAVGTEIVSDGIAYGEGLHISSVSPGAVMYGPNGLFALPAGVAVDGNGQFGEGSADSPFSVPSIQIMYNIDSVSLVPAAPEPLNSTFLMAGIAMLALIAKLLSSHSSEASVIQVPLPIKAIATFSRC